MNLIDRYIYAVGQYLPMDIRDDILEELRTNIEDMLPGNYTEKDAYEVLEKLGSPMKLANEYNPQRKYLIGPGYFDKYISILKIVVGICVIVFTSISTINFIVGRGPINLTDVIVGVFTSAITGGLVGAVQAMFWVTMIFAILETSGVELGHIPLKGRAWTPDSLAGLNVNDKMQISRGQTIFTMITTIIFTGLLYLQPQLIAVYTKADNGSINIIPLFHAERLKAYMIFIFILAIFQLSISVWKYISRNWTRPLIILNGLNNILMSLLLVIMVSDNQLFNSSFIPIVSKLIDTPIGTTTIWFNRIKWIFGAFFIGISTWDSIAIFYKSNKK